VPHGLDDVAGARLALGPDHGRTLVDAPEGLAQVLGSADERHGEVLLDHVHERIGRGQDLGLVDHVHAQGLQDLRLDEVSDAAFRHHRNGDRVHDLQHLDRVGHPGHPALGPDVRRDPLQGHDGHRAGLFRDTGLLGVGDVHDHSALLHFGEPALHQLGAVAQFG